MDFKNLFRPLNHFQMSRDFLTFPKYTLGTPWIILKNDEIFFFRGENFLKKFQGGPGPKDPPPWVIIDQTPHE